MADGSVSIEALLTTDKFDKQKMKLEKKLDDIEKKDLTITAEEQGLKQTVADYEKLREEVGKASQEVERLKKLPKDIGSVKASPYLTELNQAKATYSELSEQLKAQNKEYASAQNKLSKMAQQHAELTNQAKEYRTQIEAVQLQKQQAEVEKIKDGFKGVGSSLQDAVKRAGHLVLGIFAIRSSYQMLKRASSDLAQYDQQYATDLEYIRYVLTQMLAPVLRFIVSLAMQLLGLINSVLNALFGINIFSKGSAESFNKMKAGASGASKAVKEIKKQLAGFDEINMLTDQSDTGTSGGAGGVGMPSMDLSALQGKRPEWLEWLVQNKDLILAVLAGIAGGLVAIKLGLDPITSIGIGAMIGGVVYAIEGLINYLNDPSWKNFGKIIQGIGVFIIGLGVAFLGLPAIVTGVVVLILGTIIKYWEQIKGFLQSGIDWLTGKSDWVRQMFGDVIGNIYDYFVQKLQNMLNYVDSQFKAMKKIFDGFIEFFKGVFTGNWEQAWKGLLQVVSGIVQLIINKINYVIQTVQNKVILIAKTMGDIFGNTFKKIVNAVLGTIENLLNSPIRAINDLIGIINNVPRNKSRKIKYL